MPTTPQPDRGERDSQGNAQYPDPTREAWDSSDAGDAGDAGNADEINDAEPESADLPDVYALLGVSVSASSAEIRRAYLRLVKQWHPDHFTGASDPLRARAERQIRRLNEAYATLSDAQSRATYDAQRAGRGAPVGDVINVFGQRGAASATYFTDAMDEHASDNPNGAGQFFGLLAMILALGLIGGAISGGAFGGGVASLVILVGIVGLLLAATFFVSESPLARWANQTMEAEPRQFAQAMRHARRRQRPAAPQPSPANEATSAAAEAHAQDGDVSAVTFDALIDEALTAVPHTFDEYLRNVIVRAEQEPDEETLRSVGTPEGHTLLGLYRGVSLTRRGAGEAGPEVITIYRGPITRYCGGDLERIRRQVRATVLHELAHHFGIDHEEMPEWVK